MKIEAGRYYRTRDGQKVGPMQRVRDGDYGWNTGGRAYGRWDDDGEDGNVPSGVENAADDIIAEWTDTPDLTALTTPYGLLSDATREALRAHGGPWEVFTDYLDGWGMWGGAGRWPSDRTYRVKPAPPKPREWWSVFAHGIHVGMWSRLQDAESAAAEYTRDAVEIIHVREVLP